MLRIAGSSVLAAMVVHALIVGSDQMVSKTMAVATAMGEVEPGKVVSLSGTAGIVFSFVTVYVCVCSARGTMSSSHRPTATLSWLGAAPRAAVAMVTRKKRKLLVFIVNDDDRKRLSSSRVTGICLVKKLDRARCSGAWGSRINPISLEFVKDRNVS